MALIEYGNHVKNCYNLLQVLGFAEPKYLFVWFFFTHGPWLKRTAMYVRARHSPAVLMEVTCQGKRARIRHRILGREKRIDGSDIIMYPAGAVCSANPCQSCDRQGSGFVDLRKDRSSPNFASQTLKLALRDPKGTGSLRWKVNSFVTSGSGEARMRF